MAAGAENLRLQSPFGGVALGVLCDALMFRARDPVFNRMMGELALRVAPIGLELGALHCWSEWRQLCDDLSRADRDFFPATLG